MDIEQRLAKLEAKVFGESSAEPMPEPETLKLKCGLEIALQDYYEIVDGEKKTEFTFDEACAIKEKTGGKWRVPTRQEWVQIYGELGTDGTWKNARDSFVEKLHMNGSYGVYWSSTVSSSSLAHSLYFNSGAVSPEHYGNRGSGFSVRCLRNQEDGDE